MKLNITCNQDIPTISLKYEIKYMIEPFNLELKKMLQSNTAKLKACGHAVCIVKNYTAQSCLDQEQKYGVARMKLISLVQCFNEQNKPSGGESNQDILPVQGSARFDFLCIPWPHHYLQALRFKNLLASWMY